MRGFPGFYHVVGVIQQRDGCVVVVMAVLELVITASRTAAAPMLCNCWSAPLCCAIRREGKMTQLYFGTF